MADALTNIFDPFNISGANTPNRPNLNTPAPYTMPAYGSLTGANGQLLPQFQATNFGDVQMDPNIASDNPWAQMMSQQVQQQTAQQVDAAQSQASSGTANAWDSLAAKGGLTNGMRQQVATTGANNAMAGKQAARATGAQNQLGVLANATQQQTALDQSNRAYNTGVQDVNLQTQLANQQGQNSYNQNQYQTQMQTWAAQQQATATEHSGKKG